MRRKSTYEAGKVRILLASASRRRNSWLKEKITGYDCEIEARALKFNEPKPKWGLLVEEQVELTCLAKASAAVEEMAIASMAGKKDPDVIIVSDTIVSDPDDYLMPLGKPDDQQHAMAMLLRLSGSRHRVWSSTAIITCDGKYDALDDTFPLHGEWVAQIWTESAIVEFDHLTQDELIGLITNDSWKGKAGAYDMAADASKYTRLIEGNEVTVLGFASSAMSSLMEIFHKDKNKSEL